MQKIFYNVLLLVLLSLATSCTTLDNLKKTIPSGTPFQQSLSKYYLIFADEEAKEYDWQDSDHFAKKGLAAAKGSNILPEEVKNWYLPKNNIAELQAARVSLMERLENNARDNNPNIAAKAQFSFDCWVEEQGENWQFDRIAKCKKDFYDSMAELKHNRQFPHNGPSYMILFGIDKAELTKHAAKTVDKVALDIKKHKSYHIILNGYADSSGSNKYNYALSKRRADMVRKSLVAKGVKSSSITERAFGSSLAEIQSHHDAKSRRGDRKVVIVINY